NPSPSQVRLRRSRQASPLALRTRRLDRRSPSRDPRLVESHPIVIHGALVTVEPVREPPSLIRTRLLEATLSFSLSSMPLDRQRVQLGQSPSPTRHLRC